MEKEEVQVLPRPRRKNRLNCKIRLKNQVGEYCLN